MKFGLILVLTAGAAWGLSLGGADVTTWGEAIYWKPTYGGVDWATGYSGPENLQPFVQNSGAFTAHAVCHNDNWGFQAGGRYQLPCNGIFGQVSGGYIQFKDGSRSVGALTSALSLQTPFLLQIIPIVPSLSVVGAGRGDLRSHYWDVDLRGGISSEVTCHAVLFVFGGARYINLRERLDTHIAGTTFTLLPASVDLLQRRQLEFSGAGPEIGIGGDFCLCGKLSLEMECALMALIGSRKQVSRARLSAAFSTGESPLLADVNQRFDVSRCVAVIPGLDMRLALNASGSLGCFQLKWRIGYQLHYYWKAFNQMLGSVNGNPALSGLPNYRDVGYAGPFVGGSIAF